MGSLFGGRYPRIPAYHICGTGFINSFISLRLKGKCELRDMYLDNGNYYLDKWQKESLYRTPGPYHTPKYAFDYYLTKEQCKLLKAAGATVKKPGIIIQGESTFDAVAQVLLGDSFKTFLHYRDDLGDIRKQFDIAIDNYIDCWMKRMVEPEVYVYLGTGRPNDYRANDGTMHLGAVYACEDSFNDRLFEQLPFSSFDYDKAALVLALASWSCDAKVRYSFGSVGYHYDDDQADFSTKITISNPSAKQLPINKPIL